VLPRSWEGTYRWWGGGFRTGWRIYLGGRKRNAAPGVGVHVVLRAQKKKINGFGGLQIVRLSGPVKKKLER